MVLKFMNFFKVHFKLNSFKLFERKHLKCINYKKFIYNNCGNSNCSNGQQLREECLEKYGWMKIIIHRRRMKVKIIHYHVPKHNIFKRLINMDYITNYYMTITKNYAP